MMFPVFQEDDVVIRNGNGDRVGQADTTIYQFMDQSRYHAKATYTMDEDPGAFRQREVGVTSTLEEAKTLLEGFIVGLGKLSELGQ